MTMENQYGLTKSTFQKKRMTHPNGWMVLLPQGETYILEFENAEHMSNMSFNGQLSLFGVSNFNIIFIAILLCF